MSSPAMHGRRLVASAALLALAAAALAAAAATGGLPDLLSGEGGGSPPGGSPSGGSPVDLGAAPAGRDGKVRVGRDLRYRGRSGPALDVYRPPGPPRSRPAVLVVHGGSWRFGDKADVAPTAEALARAGFVAFGVGYTLVAPGRAGFPRQPRELRAAVRYVRRNAARFGADPSRVGALGISAGAHLAALIATDPSGPRPAVSRPDAVVAWSAPFALGGAALRRVLEAEVAAFLGCRRCPRRAAAASPATHVTPDDPPLLIVNSSRELIPASQARLMARRVRAAGGRARLLIAPGALHAPLFEPTVLEPTIAFLRRRLR